MRININAGGSGSVAAVQTKFDLLYYSIEDTIEDLRSINRKINNVNGGPHHLEGATESIERRIETENIKKDNLKTTAQQFNTFLSNAIYVDTSVAQNVKQSQKTFYKDFPWLRPQDVDAEPGFWEQLANSWNEFWGDVGDWLSNLVTNIVEWVKEHAVEIIVGLVCIVVGAVLTYLTGGAFLAALLAGLKAAAISGVIGGAISGVLALFTGGDFWEAFGDGFASGFMWGGIFSAISSAISAIRGFMHGANAVDDVANVADDVVNSTDDITNIVDDVAKNSEKYRPENLMDELASSGNKYTLDDVLLVKKNSGGQLLWLEKGNPKGGLKHILQEHSKDFVGRGIDSADDILKILDDALNSSPIRSGRGAKGPYADYIVNGKLYRLAYGDNGFIVSFFPK